MSQEVRISVCIPTFNRSKTLEYTIRSVVDQNYLNWELVVIDDSDNSLTESLVSKFSKVDSRVRYKKNDVRLGLVKNWNESIKQARLDYVYILHHDDFLMPGVLQAYNNFIKAFPQCGLIHSNCHYASLPYYFLTIGITQDIPILGKGDEAVERILFNNNIACSTVMVKKECYDRLGGFDESVWVSPDWEMWARIGKHYDIGHLDIIGCTVVIDNQNAHLSAIEINELYHQQQYYYKRIISFFSESYILDHPSILNSAEANLRKTILGLGMHYLRHFRFSTSISYLKRIHYTNISSVFVTLIRSIIKSIYLTLFVRKKSIKEIFESF